MRLYFALSPNAEAVPFDYQHKLTGVFHKWLRHNSLHDKISLYSLSWLGGGRATGRHLDFPRGAQWFVAFFEEQYAEQLVRGALRDPLMFYGMRVESISQQSTPDFGTQYRFKAASPIFVKGKTPADGTTHPHHYLWHEPEADEIMTATLIHKMDEANRGAETEIFDAADKQVKIRFDRDYPSPKIKLVTIKGIKHKANSCPIIAEGTEKSLQFLSNVGAGNGTGSCFGSLD